MLEKKSYFINIGQNPEQCESKTWWNKVIFEDEYLNGKRNGKGKEYGNENGKLLFEGEFLNEKEWIGTVYDEYGNSKYKLNNNINGKGKEYWINGNLSFEGG